MRQSKRQLTDREGLRSILEHGSVCQVALQDTPYPYIVAMNYGYFLDETGLVLYFHGAKEGKKIDLLRQNPQVGFQIQGDSKLVTGERPCQYTNYFESIVGGGTLEVVHGEEERIYGLNLLMQHHGWRGNAVYERHPLELTAVLKLTVQDFTGKRYWK